jgi:hypothetical protein
MLMLLGALAVLAIGPLFPAKAGTFWQNRDGTSVGCSSPCVVRFSQGGIIGQFFDLAEQIRDYGGEVIIDGDCYSACVTLADTARPNACITKRARFFLHKATATATFTVGDKTYYPGDRLEPLQSADINAYIKARGGYPSQGFRKISYKQALRFWPKC